MTKPKAQTDPLSWLFPRLEHRGQPLAPRWTFARRLAINVALGLAIILVSLVVGMIGYHYFEGMGAIKAFGAAAMILGGMGPYSEPTTNGGEIFAGLYAIYCGLLLIGVTGLILSPVIHRVMHQLHLPDEEDPDEASRSPSLPNRSQSPSVASIPPLTGRGMLESGSLAGQWLAPQALEGLLGLIAAAIALLVSEHFQILARRGVDDAAEFLGVLDHVMLAGCGKSRRRRCGKDEGGDKIAFHGMHSFLERPPREDVGLSPMRRCRVGQAGARGRPPRPICASVSLPQASGKAAKATSSRHGRACPGDPRLCCEE